MGIDPEFRLVEPLVVGERAIQLRPATPEDEPFLREVYARTRAEELSVVPWTDEQKAAFLRQQFDAQDHHYRAYYPGAVFLVILVDEQAAGRLYLHPGRTDMRVIDIALLPPWRGHGIGGALLRWLQTQVLPGRRLSIHVELLNPARRLYERLGFRPVSEHGVYCLMEWVP